MSHNPLLTRPSSPTGSASYGALFATHSIDTSSPHDALEGQPHAVQRGERGKSAQGWRPKARPESPEFTPAAFGQRPSRSRRRRSLSQARSSDTEIELKASHRGKRQPLTIPPDHITGQSRTASVASSAKSSSNSSCERRSHKNYFLENSPYAQVRASVSATDDTNQSISTPRMWVLSLTFALTGSATNLFFSLRYPSVFITPVIALVLVHPLGKMWDLVLKHPDDPEESFQNGLRQDSASVTTPLRVKLRLWLAQGRWNEKEHACVYISSNVSFGFAFATDVIVEQHKFYKQEVPILYQILLTVSTQILGYAFAGLTRRYLVRPAAMIWPGTLMPTAMFATMHKKENKPADGWTISRYKFFIFVWMATFLWYFLPGLLFPALSYFNVITWFAPKNVVVANLFGVSSGLGLFPMTFDWAQIAYIGSPLLTPWWAAANVVGGLVLVMWFLAPILYYTNTFFSAYLPILSSEVFDNTGEPYDVAKILTPDFLFDRPAYEAYSRVYLPITYVLSYAVQFAALSSLITHTTCWHGREIWRQSKEAFSEYHVPKSTVDYQPIPNPAGSDLPHQPTKPTRSTTGGPLHPDEDVHCRLMRRYPDAPMYWYLLTLILTLGIGIFVVEYYPVYLPWYGVLLALAVTAVLFIPVGIVMAITNQHCSLYLVSQLMAGTVFPGRPVANMVFVTYSYITSAQGVKFSSDLKLGHYMKIPPRLLFTVQVVATLVSSLTQIGTLNWMFSHVADICTPEASNGLSCPLARVHFNGSILWGVVGPARFFGPGALYRPLIWAFPFGALAPIALWLLHRRQQNKLRLRHTSMPNVDDDDDDNDDDDDDDNNIASLTTITRGRTILQKINLPVLFGSLSWIPPATGLNFSVWALVCFVFNSRLRSRRAGWWAKYTMTLSAALDSGLAFAVLFVFFVLVYPGWIGGGGSQGLRWWGTEVYKQGCDWMGCAFLKVGPGERFGVDGS